MADARDLRVFFREFSKALAVASAALLSAALGCRAQSPDPPAASEGFIPFGSDRERIRALLEPYGYLDEGAKWLTTSVPVCWESPPDSFAAQKKIVARAIAGQGNPFGRHSAIRFTGWGTCAPGTDGVSISIADEGPWSEVGMQRENAHPWGARRTAMLLNFEFVHWPCPAGAQHSEHCIVAIARHEFMHAAGVLHEHLRPDTPKKCRDAHPRLRDFRGRSPVKVSAFDPDSIMNYCNNIYDPSRPPDLSAIDAATIGYLYPKG